MGRKLRRGRGCWKEPGGRLETPPPARRQRGGEIAGVSRQGGEPLAWRVRSGCAKRGGCLWKQARHRPKPASSPDAAPRAREDDVAEKVFHLSPDPVERPLALPCQWNLRDDATSVSAADARCSFAVGAIAASATAPAAVPAWLAPMPSVPLLCAIKRARVAAMPMPSGSAATVPGSRK